MKMFHLGRYRVGCVLEAVQCKRQCVEFPTSYDVTTGIMPNQNYFLFIFFALQAKKYTHCFSLTIHQERKYCTVIPAFLVIVIILLFVHVSPQCRIKRSSMQHAVLEQLRKRWALRGLFNIQCCLTKKQYIGTNLTRTLFRLHFLRYAGGPCDNEN